MAVTGSCLITKHNEFIIAIARLAAFHAESNLNKKVPVRAVSPDF
jgi:hypothetical protein